MKTITLLKSAALVAVFTFIGCSKDEAPAPAPIVPNEMAKTAKMEQIPDVIAEIAEGQIEAQRDGRINQTSNGFLPSCATVTTVTQNNTWTRTIDFGTNGCEYYNGAILKGKIILSGSVDFDNHFYTSSYSFEDFYYDDINVEGAKTLTKSLQSTPANSEAHPVVTFDLDFTYTFPNNDVFTRVGTRTREMVEGYDTRFNPFDNAYIVTGNWNSTNPDGETRQATIQEPLKTRSLCPYIRSGVLEVRHNADIAVIDYGDGNCDNVATVSINGGAPTTIHF